MASTTFIDKVTIITANWLNAVNTLVYNVFNGLSSPGVDGTILVSNGTTYVEESGATARTSLGLAIGTDVQAWDTALDDISGLALTDGNIIVGDGSNWVAESGDTARTSLGLGTGDSPQFTSIELGHATDTTITRTGAGNIAVEGNTIYRAGGTDVPVTDGGTGASTASGARDNLHIPLRGYIAGLTLSNNVTDATNDIDIAVGEAASDDSVAMIRLSSSITKRLDAAWAVGTNQGGLDTGAIANTVYHVFLIRRSDTGVVDALFSTSATSPTMPTNYDQKRRIGSIIRTGGSIVLFSQNNDEFLRLVPFTSVNTTNPGTSAVLSAVDVPTGIKVQAILSVRLVDTTAATETRALITSPDQTDTAPTATLFSLGTLGESATTQVADTIMTTVRTNTSGQIRYRLDGSDADRTIRIVSYGWLDTRGRLD